MDETKMMDETYAMSKEGDVELESDVVDVEQVMDDLEESDPSDGHSILRKLESMVELTGTWQEDEQPNSVQVYQMQEQLKLMSELMTFIETSEASREDMEHSNKKLVKENKHLHTKLATEVERVDQLHKKVKSLYEVVDQHAELKEAYNSLADQINKADAVERTSVESQHEETSLVQMALRHAPVCLFNQSKNKQEAVTESEEPSLIVTKSEILNLAEGLSNLKTFIAEREQTMTKVDKKEKRHRAHLFQMGKEILQLKEANNSQSQELEAKTKEIKMKDTTIEKIETEVTSLRQQTIEQQLILDHQRVNAVEQQKIIDKLRVDIIEQQKTSDQQRVDIMEHQKLIEQQRVGILELRRDVENQILASLKQSSVLETTSDTSLEDLPSPDPMTLGSEAEKRFGDLLKNVKRNHGLIETESSSCGLTNVEHDLPIVPQEPDLIIAKAVSRLVTPNPVRRGLSQVSELNQRTTAEPKLSKNELEESLSTKRSRADLKSARSYLIDGKPSKQILERVSIRSRTVIGQSVEPLVLRPSRLAKLEPELAALSKQLKEMKKFTDAAASGSLINLKLRSLIEVEGKRGNSSIFDILPSKTTHSGMFKTGSKNAPSPISSPERTRTLEMKGSRSGTKESTRSKVIVKMPSVVISNTLISDEDGTITPKNSVPLVQKSALNDISLSDKTKSGIPIPKLSVVGNVNSTAPRLSGKHTAPKSLADKSLTDNTKPQNPSAESAIEKTASRIPQAVRPLPKSSVLNPKKTGGRAFPFVMVKRQPSSMKVPPPTPTTKIPRPTTPSGTTADQVSSRLELTAKSHNLAQPSTTSVKKHVTALTSRRSRLSAPMEVKSRSSSQPQHAKKSTR